MSSLHVEGEKVSTPFGLTWRDVVRLTAPAVSIRYCLAKNKKDKKAIPARRV